MSCLLRRSNRGVLKKLIKTFERTHTVIEIQLCQNFILSYVAYEILKVNFVLTAWHSNLWRYVDLLQFIVICGNMNFFCSLWNRGVVVSWSTKTVHQHILSTSLLRLRGKGGTPKSLIVRKV